MHLAQRLLLGGTALALAAFLSVADSGPAFAQKKKGPQPQLDAQLLQTLQVLHSTKVILEGADHDYGGHRAAAVGAIGKAQHQLRLAMGIKGPGKGVKAPKNPMPESQDVSDKQLAGAIPVLRQAIVTLNNANHDYKGHRANAVRDVGEAAGQLEKALKYRMDVEKKKA